MVTFGKPAKKHTFVRARFQIVLSFAPSAAAGWHCERARLTAESHSARQSLFLKALHGEAHQCCDSIAHCIASHRIALHCIAWHCSATQCLLFGTVPPRFLLKMFQKQDGMLAFFYTVPPIFSPKIYKKQDETPALFTFKRGAFGPKFITFSSTMLPFRPGGGHPLTTRSCVRDGFSPKSYFCMF